MPDLDLDYATLAAESRAAQGLPPGVEDPDVLAEVRRICAAHLLRRTTPDRRSSDPSPRDGVTLR